MIQLRVLVRVATCGGMDYSVPAAEQNIQPFYNKWLSTQTNASRHHTKPIARKKHHNVFILLINPT